MKSSVFVAVALWAATSYSAKPNVILLMADDLGWSDVGYLGRNKLVQTPNLDALAKRAITFQRFYAGAPVCSPTRGSVLTGRHPSRYGIDFANDGHLPKKEITLAELLKQEGYRTGHFGKWHLGTLTKTVRDANRGGPKGAKHYSPPQAHGFDVCFSTESKVPTYDPLLKPKGKVRRTWFEPVKPGEKGVPYGTRYWDENGKEITENTRGDDSRVIMDRVLPFIDESRKGNKPFFSVVWFHAPHLPVVANKRRRKQWASHDPYTQHYYGCIAAMDEQIGRLVAHLKKRDLEDNTILWFCSDNGPEGRAGKAPGTATGLRGRKRDLYEGGIRVPGIFSWPAKFPRPGRCNAPSVTSDILPTIAAFCGIKKQALPKGLDGMDIGPILRGEKAARGTAIGFHSRNTSAWIGDRYKLVKRNNSLELFDLQKDAGEQTNVAASLPKVAREMSASLQRWRADCLKDRGTIP